MPSYAKLQRLQIFSLRRFLRQVHLILGQHVKAVKDTHRTMSYDVGHI